MKTDFEKVYPLMSPEEQHEHYCYSMSGAFDRQNNIVLMGQEAYDRVKNYEQEMIKKYLSQALKKEEKVVILKNKPKNKGEQTWKKKWKRD